MLCVNSETPEPLTARISPTVPPSITDEETYEAVTLVADIVTGPFD